MKITKKLDKEVFSCIGISLTDLIEEVEQFKTDRELMLKDIEVLKKEYIEKHSKEYDLKIKDKEIDLLNKMSLSSDKFAMKFGF